jgi:glutathione S-transferase
VTITLYEMRGTRSERVHWTLLELGLEYESVEGPSVFGATQLAMIHPLKRVPALRDDGCPLFESAAICNWLADTRPESGLLARPGDWRRALHDQWVAFTLAELEAHLWSTARNQFVYDKQRRVPEIIEQNAREAMRALEVLDDQLANGDFLIGGSFSLTDIFVGYAIHWAEFQGLLSDFAHLQRYHSRLLELPKCTFTPLIAPR